MIRTAYRVRLDAATPLASSSGPRLVVANHPSVLDPTLVAAHLAGNAHVIVSKEAARGVVWRAALSGCDAHVADLSEAQSVRRIARLIAQGKTVIVFPENRVSRADAASKVYEAPAMVAARTGVPVFTLHIRHGAATHDGAPRRGVTMTLRAAGCIELSAGLPARERRRLATDQLLSMMQRAAVLARPRRTLFEAFLDALDQHGAGTLVIEDIRQIQESYGVLRKVSLALGRLISRVSAEREIVGVLLPNTVAAVGTLLGASAMNRVAAMLNYSAGATAVRNCVRIAGIRTVVTSRRFVEVARLERVLEALSDCTILYLEDLRSSMRIADKLWLVSFALWQPRLATRRVNPRDVAVVLFTSGSEGKPKGVALSHDGILANMAQMAAAIDFGPADKFLNALPMYHTYGLIACTLMPIFHGTRLFLYTNPLHYRIIPEIAYTRDCTYLFGTSTFLGNYARQARAADFATVRYVISGGEKLNPDVARTFAERFGLRVLEGYGATECGPAICLNTPQRFKSNTVGRFLPGVEFQLHEVSGIARGGMLHVRSPNVMMGYMFDDQPGVIREAHSEAGPGWYAMGDIVEVDKDGFVSVLGRLKRFAKVAGEMVQLELVERVARECSPAYQHAATVGSSSERGETTVLFTTDPNLDRGTLRHAARALGLQELVVARSVVHVKVLPVLGSGKTDYVALSDRASALPEEANVDPTVDSAVT